ncbi:hypothetical protein M422DRAFT_229180 [Sphaerobolus stellatus SS14]|uniref:Prion-inhibition and propagation HeLo domain-containing protein n=1 Tax=Sphaerobolus stellatus (strain SS14) TaxID=990650 RepID=A0A0C9VX20_SPHS4|nr:hypothetical protein M422DRAFT_229180 [Sphaerobolus stellatus SS14]
MAEAFGIVSGAIGIATAFTACVDCFGYIQLGRHFGRDFETNKLILDSARLRLTRWGQAVHVYDDPKLGRPGASVEDVRLAGEILFQILVLFSNTEKISKEYQLVPETTQMGPVATELRRKIIDLATRRTKKGPRLLKLAEWALKDASQFKSLREDVLTLLDQLEKHFPPPPQEIKQLLKEEVDAVQSNMEQLQLLKDITEHVDSPLQNAVNETLKGHKYSGLDIKGKAQVGDAFRSSWTRGAIGHLHTYDTVIVGESGKVLLGNEYGGKGFWDD